MTTPPAPCATIRELRQLLTQRACSADDILCDTYTRFARYDAHLGTTLELYDKNSVRPAAVTSTPSLLAGIPGLLKDNICVAGRTMTCASRILKGYRAPYSSTVATKLMDAGACIVGRANMDEFAMGSSTTTSAYQQTRNPYNPTRVAGGSSGGSVAAVAAGLVPWALGSETGGSVRQPAALCGVVGMKPTYGLVSRYGLTAYASSTDQISPVTRTVWDNAAVLSVIAGQESPVRDSTARPRSVDYDLTRKLDGVLPDNLTIGVITNAFDAPGIDPQIRTLLRAALDALAVQGARIVEVTLPTMDLSAAVYFVVSRAEAASNLARFDGARYGHRSANSASLMDMYVHSRMEGFGAEVQRRILVGTYVLTQGHADQYYQKACEVREAMRAEAAEIFTKVDCLFAPVSPIEAFRFGELDPMALDLQDYFTAFANLAGIPALAIPCGFLSSGLPTGFQLMGPAWSEELLYRVGYAYEQAMVWHEQRPTDAQMLSSISPS